MAESQNIEWKRSWHDKYLEWICGFANAQGGTIYIGKDDDGSIHGLSDSKHLLETIPQKIRSLLGLTIDVNLHETSEGDFIEIPVHPQSVPVSYRGHYYYRSGSTKSELTGASLNEFLLKKSGRTWDASIEERATLADIDPASIQRFLKDAEQTGRLPDADDLAPVDLLKKLRLARGDQLTLVPVTPICSFKRW
jgi:ATP-dependent DNA helicase RecG